MVTITECKTENQTNYNDEIAKIGGNSFSKFLNKSKFTDNSYQEILKCDTERVQITNNPLLDHSLTSYQSKDEIYLNEENIIQLDSDDDS